MPLPVLILLLMLAIAPEAPAAPDAADSQPPIRIQRDIDASRVTVLYRERPLLVYVHHTTQYKPYARNSTIYRGTTSFWMLRPTMTIITGSCTPS